MHKIKKSIPTSFLEQRCNFIPFVISVDGMLGKEAKPLLKYLAYLYMAKWDLTYSQIRDYLNTKISIACLRAAHHCLRGSHVPSTCISQAMGRWNGSFLFYSITSFSHLLQRLMYILIPLSLHLDKPLTKEKFLH